METKYIRGNMSGITIRRYDFEEYGPKFTGLMNRTFGNYRTQIESNIENLEELKQMIEGLESTAAEIEKNGKVTIGYIKEMDPKNVENEALKKSLQSIQDNAKDILCLIQQNTESSKHHIAAVSNLAEYSKGRWCRMVEGDGVDEFPGSATGQEMIICHKADLMTAIDEAYDHYNEVWDKHDKSEYVAESDGRDMFVPEPSAEAQAEADKEYGE